MNFLGNYFWNLGTPVFNFNVFITEIYLTNNWSFINCRRERTLLMYDTFYSPSGGAILQNLFICHNFIRINQKICRQIVSSQGRRDRGPWGHVSLQILALLVAKLFPSKDLMYFLWFLDLPPALLLRIATIKSGESMKDSLLT